jgi:AcrR family transcriptional regulator
MPPRARLSRTAVVETAEVLVDRDGWQQLTMTALAAKLGVRGPSLYSHVGSIEDLLAEVQECALAACASRLQRAAMGKAGATCFAALAHELRAFATEHPGLYDLAMSEAIDQERMNAAGEPAQAALRAVVESFGIVDPPFELQLTCFAALHGVIALDRSRLFAGKADTSDLYSRTTDLVILMLTTEGARN